MTTLKVTKTVAIIDADESFIKSILNLVSDKYNFSFTKDVNADYVFHSVDGYEVLRYKGIRTFVTGENVTPNFMISDYALSFEKMIFSDRNLWFPLIKLYAQSYQALTRSRKPATEVLSSKTDFCAYVMSNTTNSSDERTRIFDLLSTYKQVNSGGKWKNNVGGPVADKQIFQAKHKFVIAFENCSYPGYLTEKFADAAAADAVPIYWGDPDVGQIFNTKAFINCHDFKSLEDVVEKVKEVDQNDDLYLAMISEPWFKNGSEPECLRDNHMRSFLTHIFDQPVKTAFRRNLGRWGKKKEAQLFNMYFRPHRQLYFLLRRAWRKLWHTIFR